MNNLLAGILILLNVPVFAAETGVGKKLRMDMKFLTSKNLNGRVANTPGESLAADYLKRSFQKMGLKTETESFLLDCAHRGTATVQGKNVIAALPSSLEGAKTIVIGAHFDGVRYPAAHDNASGTVMLLAIAELMSDWRWNYNFLFVAFGAEEKGVCGSQYFVSHHSTGSYLYMINMDMVGKSLKDKNSPIQVVGDDENLELREAFRRSADFYKTKINFGSDLKTMYEWASDHRSFHNVGIPAVMLISGNGEDWHQPTDTENKIEYQYLEKFTFILFETILTLDPNPR